MTEQRRLAILAEGNLEFHHGKTALSILRYRPDEVVVVIDREHAGRTTRQAVGLGGDTPIVGDVSSALPYRPTALLIGVAPRGGGLPAAWRGEIMQAIRVDHYPVPIPSLTRLIKIYEDAAGWTKPAPVVGIALNTRSLDDAAAGHAIAEAESETGLPVTDPVRFEAGVLVDAVLTWAAGARERSQWEEPATP
jgi:uncharacterized NAD-dependent epimerase/dehydratase family protein